MKRKTRGKTKRPAAIRKKKDPQVARKISSEIEKWLKEKRPEVNAETLFDVQRAQLGDKNLRGANLNGAYLLGSDLSQADLGMANLTFAFLDGVNMSGADLGGAKLTGAIGVTQEQIASANGDIDTVLPEGLVHPEHWLGVGHPKPLDHDVQPQTDAECLVPGMGFQKIAETIVNFVDRAATGGQAKEELPLLTIGIYGPWGGGKSTLIRCLKSRFQNFGDHKSDKYLTFTLNPWKWDGKGDLHDYVRQSFSQQARQSLGFWGSVFLEARTLFRHFGQVIWFLVLASLLAGGVLLVLWILNIDISVDGVWTHLKDSLLGANASGSNWAAIAASAPALWGLKVVWGGAGRRLGDLLEHRLFGSATRELGSQGLATAYQDIAAARAFVFGPARKKPYIFFIDDLDRCPPERVAEFVESVHSLTAAGCVTFLACDRNYVAASLAVKHKDIAQYYYDKEIEFGSDFLDKIVQVPFYVPSVSEQDIYDLGLATRGDVPSEDLGQGAAPAAAGGAGLKRGGKKSKAKKGTPKLDSTKLSEVIGQVLASFVEPLQINLRRVKSISNSISLYLEIRGVENEVEAKRLTAFLFAERIDPRWLDGHFHGDGHKETKLGQLGEPATRLAVLIGEDKSEMLDYYRLIGRLPRPESLQGHGDKSP